MLINLNKLSEQTKILKNFFVLSIPQYFILGSITSDYKLSDKNEVNNELYRILNNDLMDEYINKIKSSNKDIVSITYDSNHIYGKHGEVVKGIIDSNLKINNLTQNVESIFIPTTTTSLLNDMANSFPKIIKKNNLIIQDDVPTHEKVLRVQSFIKSELSFNEMLKKINEAKIDKEIVLNKSLLEGIEIFEINKLDLSYLERDYLLDDLFVLIRETDRLIENLNNMPNLKVVSVGGNSVNVSNIKRSDWTLHNELNEYMFEITKGDFNDMKNLVIFMNNLLDDKLQNKNQENNKKILENFKNNNPEINIDEFVDLYIKDYLLHYQNYHLLKNSDKLLNNNMNIVEAYDYKSIHDNYVLYKKYNTNIPELDELFKNTSFFIRNNFVGYNKEQIDILKENFNKFSEKYPSIFKISKYGCFCNLEFEDSGIIKMSPHGHNQEYKGASNGTSFASPEYASTLIKDIIDSKNIDFKDII